MSELREKRVKFTKLKAELILWINGLHPGWEVAEGRDFDESNEKLRHMKDSLHYSGLADDLALYIDGIYQTSTEAYREIGEKWKSLDPECCWGGDFSRPDGNHISIKFQGRK